MKFFEDIHVGERFMLGQHSFSAEEIKSFARRFIPQPFHIDEEAAARTHFGQLCASGWHTAALWMRHMIEYHRGEDEKRRLRGEPVAEFGVSPGFRELKWLQPVYVGDIITYVTEVIELRASKSRPEWGLMTMHNTGDNQRGERVLSFISTVFVQRRNGGA